MFSESRTRTRTPDLQYVDYVVMQAIEKILSLNQSPMAADSVTQNADALDDSHLDNSSTLDKVPLDGSTNSQASHVSGAEDSNSLWSGMGNSSSGQHRGHVPQMLPFVPRMQDRMRRRLRYYFMNPIEKWKAKGRFPWKLGLQVIKIIFITVQLILFGFDSSKYQQLQWDAAVTLRHMFLENWDAIREVAAYPPAVGAYAVYTREELYVHVDHIVNTYSRINVTAIGSIGYDNDNGTMMPIVFCKTFYRRGTVFAYNATLFFDNTPVESCLEIDTEDIVQENFSISDYLASRNRSLNFDRLISISIKFSLKTVFLKSLTRFDSPDCYRLNVSVHYDNSKHDSQVMVNMQVLSDKLDCQVNVEYAENDKTVYIFRQVLNVVVVLLCVFSFVLCTRSLYNAQRLRKLTVSFFKKHFGKGLSLHDQFEFVDLWYVMMIVNDVLILTGTAIKFQIEQQTVEGDQYNICSIFLGTGNLLVWIGVLRYLGFFQKYNILILTLKRAMPNVLRFVLCALMIYCGFCFCGWVVLGPYHIKFRELSTTSECLFALMNGDDLFATFAIMVNESSMVWWFSRIYLYLFISLFIYVVISLFISVIMDSYETIKEYYENGFPLSDLHKFISECNDDISSGAFRQEPDHPATQSLVRYICCCSDMCTTREGEVYERF